MARAHPRRSQADGYARAEVGVDARPVANHCGRARHRSRLEDVTDDPAHHADALGVVQRVPYKRRGLAEVAVLGVQVVGVAAGLQSRARRCPWSARRARAPARG